MAECEELNGSPESIGRAIQTKRLDDLREEIAYHLEMLEECKEEIKKLELLLDSQNLLNKDKMKYN